MKGEERVEEMDMEVTQPAKKRRLELSSEGTTEAKSDVERMDEEPSEDTIKWLFAQHTQTTLEWIWITWIPELLAKLNHETGQACKVGKRGGVSNFAGNLV